MRIIAGKYRGRLLTAAKDLSVRPTTDRAKQTIFDMLAARVDFEGVEVLDLFCGSGSLGLEAISRGAVSATFVDHARASLDLAEKNARNLGCSTQCKFHHADVFWYLRNMQQSFSVIFADPPFRLENIGSIPEAVFESKALEPGRYLIMEHSKGSSVNLNPQHFDIIQKPFGQTTVLFLKKLSLSKP